ncbi:unnamed protein product [Symbiodinium sp. CCMP2592]|nr:unnamed protein product [Symbiodinium sp. CCMP2592]
MTHLTANSLLRPPSGSQDEASADVLIRQLIQMQNGITYLAEQVQWRTETPGRATHAQSERSELIMRVLENVDQQFQARQRWEADFQASVQRDMLALAEDMKLITLEMRTSSRVGFEHRLASMETSLEHISSQVAYMRSHEDLHDEMEKIKTVVGHQAKVWEQVKGHLDQGQDVLPSYIVATVDKHSRSLQVLSNGCVRTESRQEEAQERIMKLWRQVKHQADDIIKLQTKHAEHRSQSEELRRVLHKNVGSSTEAAVNSGACGGQQQQPQQFLLTPEAKRPTPSFSQQTAETESVEDEWWGLVDRHGWPQGGFTSEPPELPASLSRLRQALLTQQQDVMRPFYSHALGTDLTRNASSTGSQTAVPTNSSGSMPMRNTTAAEHIQGDPEDSKGISDNRWKRLIHLPELKISGAQAWETGIQLSLWKSQCITICSGIGAKFATYFTDSWKEAEKLYRIQSETLAIPQAPAVRSEDIDLDLEARLTSAMLRVLPDSVKVPVVERAGDGGDDQSVVVAKATTNLPEGSVGPPDRVLLDSGANELCRPLTQGCRTRKDGEILMPTGSTEWICGLAKLAQAGFRFTWDWDGPSLRTRCGRNIPIYLDNGLPFVSWENFREIRSAISRTHRTRVNNAAASDEDKPREEETSDPVILDEGEHMQTEVGGHDDKDHAAIAKEGYLGHEALPWHGGGEIWVCDEELGPDDEGVTWREVKNTLVDWNFRCNLDRTAATAATALPSPPHPNPEVNSSLSSQGFGGVGCGARGRGVVVKPIVVEPGLDALPLPLPVGLPVLDEGGDADEVIREICEWEPEEVEGLGDPLEPASHMDASVPETAPAHPVPPNALIVIGPEDFVDHFCGYAQTKVARGTLAIDVSGPHLQAANDARYALITTLTLESGESLLAFRRAQSNGRTERMIQQMKLEAAIAMLHGRLSPKLWPYALSKAAFTRRAEAAGQRPHAGRAFGKPAKPDRQPPTVEETKARSKKRDSKIAATEETATTSRPWPAAKSESKARDGKDGYVHPRLSRSMLAAARQPRPLPVIAVHRISFL